MSKSTETPKTPTPGTEVAVPKASAVAMPMNWRDRMKQVAVKTAEAEKPNGGFISFKSGRISIGENTMPNDRIECVIIHSLLHNKFYDTPYDSKKVTPPACYAFAREEIDLVPSEKAEDVQSLACAECPMNEWGSSLKGGRGKACSNSRRLWVLPADVITDPTKVARTEPFQCDLPVTSVKNYSRLVMELASAGMAPFQVVVEMSTKPNDDTLFQVNFKSIEQIKDEAILEALAKRNWMLDQAPFPEYPTQEELAEREAGNAPAAGARSGKF